MADTLQAVGWHLAYACPFRRGAAATAFGPAHEATWRLRHLDDTAEVYGDVCVTSVSHSRAGRSPHGGFRVSAAVAPAGDLPAARRTCGRCPANAFANPDARMAGCCGHLMADPDDEDVDAALRSAIADQRLAGRVAAAFEAVTDPLRRVAVCVAATKSSAATAAQYGVSES